MTIPKAQRESFEDGSWIETDPDTGNKTVFGSLAHKRYFERLNEVKIFNSTSYAVVASCKDVDGTRKAELIRKIVENPIIRESFGMYSWEVWTSDSPDTVIRYRDEDTARRAFRSACLHGTNGGSF